MSEAFDVGRLNEKLQTRSFGRSLIFEATVGSTLDLARDAARAGAAEGTTALADEQTAGRGRLGRSWVSPPAVNLMPSLVLRPRAGILRQIPMIAALAVCDAIAAEFALASDIKWPNDIQIAGKKLAGILIETSISEDAATTFVLVGTGINVNLDLRQYEEIRDIATSLSVELGRQVDRESLLATYLAQFERLYEAAKSGGSPFAAWRARLVTLGQHVRAAWPGGSADGVAEDVDDEGALLIRHADGSLITVEAGDVTLRG